MCPFPVLPQPCREDAVVSPARCFVLSHETTKPNKEPSSRLLAAVSLHTLGTCKPCQELPCKGPLRFQSQASDAQGKAELGFPLQPLKVFVRTAVGPCPAACAVLVKQSSAASRAAVSASSSPDPRGAARAPQLPAHHKHPPRLRLPRLSQQHCDTEGKTHVSWEITHLPQPQHRPFPSHQDPYSSQKK